MNRPEFKTNLNKRDSIEYMEALTQYIIDLENYIDYLEDFKNQSIQKIRLDIQKKGIFK